MNDILYLLDTEPGIIFAYGFFLLSYLYVAYCIVKIAENTRTDKAWQGWIPVLNLVLLCRVTGRSGTFAVLFFIPLANFYAIYVIFTDICELLGLPFWIGALMIFPPINIFALGYIALSTTKIEP
jgi:hypothetical protein